jgi:hypothetical protein
MKRFVTEASLCIIVAAMAAAQSQAAEVNASLSEPMQVNLLVNETECQNSPGPWITLEGNILLGDVCSKVIFKNNVKGTHTAVVVGEAEAVLLLGGTITIPKQPVRGGVGGNPHIWLQFTDGDGNAVSDEVYLGRCVQGLKVSSDLVNEAMAHLAVGATGCTNHKGPWITLEGTMTLAGLNAKLIFRNNMKGTHTAEESTTVALINAGDKIVLPKQPVRGGVGGNPLISIQFIDCDSGAGTTDPVDLGRCVQM